MNIEQYISQLLYRYACVTVPNFGAFLTETISATIQESTNTFLPPKKAVSFNSYIKNNDGLLANHIALAEKISYEEAVHKIDVVVNEWFSKLQNRDFVILKNIGLLKYNVENNIVFEVFEHTNYLTDSFGLSSYVSPMVKREVLKTVVTDETVQEELEKEPVSFEPANRNPLRSFAKYAAIVTIIMGGGTLGYVGYINQQEQSETLIVQAEVQKEVQAKIQEATFFISNPTPEVTENNIRPFHLVAGSFRSEQNAQKAVDELIEKGFADARIMEKNDQDLYPVFYGSFTTYAEAQQELTQIQAKDNPEAWLLIKNM
ncbi:SPOR domain-containing protein [Flavobacterium sp. H122]|uniref:HU domain-containing protein n=1 Tax=Flavobacterium sp. H122 TaxID=2529860 RepID=UPI0010AA8BEA|nr:SPOR domain-containing protein [Flavobacterium sp. H122]